LWRSSVRCHSEIAPSGHKVRVITPPVFLSFIETWLTQTLKKYRNWKQCREKISKEIMQSGHVMEGTDIATEVLGTSFPPVSTAVTHVTFITSCNQPFPRSKAKFRVCLLGLVHGQVTSVLYVRLLMWNWTAAALDNETLWQQNLHVRSFSSFYAAQRRGNLQAEYFKCSTSQSAQRISTCS
jgi:hypothetical protein